MLKLYTGRENIDKERFIYDRIREDGGETLVLVPDQYTLVAEEQALRYLDTECLFDVEILSMNRLGLRVLMEQGIESVRMLDKYGRFMLLSMLIREHAGDFEIFGTAAGKISFTAMLNDFISEFKQQDCSTEQLKEMISDADGDPILGAKIRELIGVISAYEEATAGRYTDSEDYISKYIAAMKDSALVRGKTFWIYGYDSISPRFADAVAELAMAGGSVNVVINRSDFGSDRRMLASLTSLAVERGIEYGIEEMDVEAYRMHKSETISRIERSLWKDVIPEAEKEANSGFTPEDLTMVCAANPYYEAESAVSYIWHLVRDLGYRLRDIQVIANDEGSMQPIIRRVFAEYGLPLFADSTRNITDSAAVGFIVGLLDFAVSRKLPQPLFSMLKTGLSGLSDGDIEELENYAVNYHIKGSMWDKPFRYGRDDIGDEAFDRLDAVRENISVSAARLESLGKSTDVSGFIRGFRKYLEDDWDLSDRVAEAAAAQEGAGLRDEAQRTVQSFEKAVELLDQIEEIMGETPFDFAEFTEIYKAGLSDVEVGVIPPTVDGLSMGTMIRTRPRGMRAVVILGANEGVMPLSPATEGLFSVDEKEYFKSRGFALGSLDDIRMDEENAAMYRVMARPSEKIYISWSMTDAEGGDMMPSQLIDSLKMLFPKIEEEKLIRKDVISAGMSSLGPNDVSPINTAEDGMRQLTARIRRNESDALAKAMLRWYADNSREKLDAMLKATCRSNDPEELGRDAAKEIFGRADGTLRLSASSIGSYMDCPFRYFVDKGLRPKEERPFASDPRSVGDVYHECLMAVARQIIEDRETAEKVCDPDGGAEALDKLVNAALDDLSGNYRGGLFISGGGEEYRMSRIREICSYAAEAMASQLTAESVTDAVFEETLRRNGRFAPIMLTEDGDKVIIEGKIDRADLIDVGGEERVRIIDYKTGGDTLDLWKMRQGYKMQLMIYLMAAAAGDTQPAGMFYFNIKDPIEGANSKSANEFAKLKEKPAGEKFKLKGAYINEEGVLSAMPKNVLSSEKCGISREEYEEVREDVLARISEAAKDILNGRISIRPLKNDDRLACGYCDYRAVCRRDRGYPKNAPRTLKPRPEKKKKNKEETGS